MNEFEALYDQLRQHNEGKGKSSRTNRLMTSDRHKKAKKVGEEAVEVAIEAVSGNRKETIEESVDLIYNLFALFVDMDISINDISKECERRRKRLGIAEKLPKK